MECIKPFRRLENLENHKKHMQNLLQGWRVSPHWEQIEPIFGLGYHYPSLGERCQKRGDLRAVHKSEDSGKRVKVSVICVGTNCNLLFYMM